MTTPAKTPYDEEGQTHYEAADEQLTYAAMCITEPGHGRDDVTPRALIAITEALLAINDRLAEINATLAEKQRGA